MNEEQLKTEETKWPEIEVSGDKKQEEPTFVSDPAFSDPVEVVPAKQQPIKKNVLAVDDGGKFKLTTLEAQLTLADKLLKQGLISSTFKSVQDVVIGMQYALELGLKPLTALNNIYVIKGKPTLWGDGPLMAIRAKGMLKDIREFYVDENSVEICFENKNLNAKYYAAVTQVWRVGEEHMQQDYFTVDDIELSDIDKSYGKKKATWQSYERSMMRYKGRTKALKSKFGDLLNGVDIAEYHHNISGDIEGFGIKDQPQKRNLNEDIKTLS